MTQTEAFQKLIDLAARVVNSTTFVTRPEDEIGAQKTARIWEAEFEALAEFLSRDCPKPKAPQVCVEVDGGNVQMVYANEGHSDLKPTVRDWDNIKAGDDDPLGDENAKAQDCGFPEQVY